MSTTIRDFLLTTEPSVIEDLDGDRLLELLYEARDLLAEADKPDTVFVAFSPLHWGKGGTIEAAKAQLKINGGTLNPYFVQKLPEGATNVYVDAFGVLRWDWAYGSDISGKCEIVAKRGY